jgi:hypothetical protein
VNNRFNYVRIPSRTSFHKRHETADFPSSPDHVPGFS